MLNVSVMISACPACATRYVVPDSAIGIDGRTVRCAKCRHSWFQDGAAPEQRPALPVEPAPPVPAPPPAPLPPAPEPAVAEQAPGYDGFAEPEAESSPWPQPEPVTPAADDDESAPDVPDLAEPAPSDPPPLAEEPVAQTGEGTPPAWDEAEDSNSSFAHEPPFRPRVNRLKLWTWAAALFALVAVSAAGAVAMYGLPDWMPLSRQTFAEAQPDLVLDFPPGRQERRTLPNGTEYFGASGTVTNVGRTRRTVPTILIVLRDARERIVYSWEVVPPKRQLAPGESVGVNEAVTDVPKSAKIAEIGWKPG